MTSLRKLELAYKLLDDMIQNPRRNATLSLIKRIKGDSKVPIDVYLHDYRSDVDKRIRGIAREILKKIKY
ncbi:MAG: hypothetical protein H8D45_08085 [Bacteroidetes bacterium]|nr:hypothetical protein [Bacteroidota bacterium]